MTDQNPLGKLLPCPFCGSIPRTLVRGNAASVKCGKQHFVATYGATRQEAIAAWNTRAHRPVEPVSDPYMLPERVRKPGENEHVVVPLEPTEAMLVAGAKAAQSSTVNAPFAWINAADLSYRAMVAASPPSRALSPDEREDPRIEVDVVWEIWQGLDLVASVNDLTEARRYEAQYQPCSLLRATTHRIPANLLQPEGEANG